MAVHKKRATEENKKEIVKKKKSHKLAENKLAEEKKPQLQESQQDVPKQEQTPISESVASPIVIPSGILQDTSKEELPQLETVSPQPLQQATDTLVSQPESATNIPIESEATADQSDKPEQQVEQQNIDQPKKKRLWIVIAIAIIFLVLIAGGLWYFRENVLKKTSIQDEITPIPIPLKNTPTPASDSAKLTIDFSKYKIKVLNGSGIRGAAAKGKEILESEKFIVGEIGNAENSDYGKTIIQAKKEVSSAFLDKLKSVLEESYRVGPNEELEDSEEVDVVIIIGSGRQ